MQEQPMQSHLLDIFWYSEKLVNLMYMLHWLILEKKWLITSYLTAEQKINFLNRIMSCLLDKTTDWILIRITCIKMHMFYKYYD